ncbi:MAG: DUF4410 domain-containing protein [Candidatus Binatia bacterium]
MGIRMVVRPHWILAVLALVGFVACSSSGTLTMKTPASQGIRPGSTVALSVEATATVSEAPKVVSRLRDRLYSKLLSEGIFRTVVPPTEPADYRLEAKLTGAREVSTFARVMLGVMTGPNIAEMSVELRDMASNRVVRAFEVAGHSASHPFSSEAGLEDAVREATEKIVEGLR